MQSMRFYDQIKDDYDQHNFDCFEHFDNGSKINIKLREIAQKSLKKLEACIFFSYDLFVFLTKLKQCLWLFLLRIVKSNHTFKRNH